jgi:hypothetical protein
MYIVFDAARCTNADSWSGSQKRNKIKPSFAKGLWHVTHRILHSGER